jgi:hypothetical protein
MIFPQMFFSIFAFNGSLGTFGLLSIKCDAKLGVNNYSKNRYHDPITGECRELKYQGLAGNANNFNSKDHCER